MYRLLIADDEELERKALRQMIMRMFTDEIEVIGEAENGREAIDLADSLRPDIITMDIKMPGIDGLHTIEEIKGVHPNIEIIVVSAFDSFNYAQKAIELNVSRYLLKPYKREELRNTLNEITGRIMKEKKERTEKLQLRDSLGHMKNLAETEWVSTLINNQVQDISLEELNKLLGLNFDYGAALVFYIKKKNSQELSGKEKQHIYLFIKNSLSKDSGVLTGPMVNNQLTVFVLKSKTDLTVTFRSYQTILVQNITKKAASVPVLEGCEIFTGAGREYTDFEGLKDSYHEAVVASRDRLYKGNVRFFKDMEEEEQEMPLPLEQEKQLMRAVQSGNGRTAEDLIQSIFESATDYYEGNVSSVTQYLTELFILLTRGTEILSTSRIAYFPKTASLHALYENSLYKLDQLLRKVREAQEKQGEDLTKRAKSFIHQNYRENLSLEYIAKKMNLSPTYFSKIFKEQTGANFIDYLTEIRVEKAKQLMLTTDMSLKEICYEVGYRDPNYFSRVFKKTESVSPKVFRRQFQR